MSRPYRTRRRLLRSYADLDENLWPLCLERQIHKLDRLILTQMSPGNIQVSQISIFFSKFLTLIEQTPRLKQKFIPWHESSGGLGREISFRPPPPLFGSMGSGSRSGRSFYGSKFETIEYFKARFNNYCSFNND